MGNLEYFEEATPSPLKAPTVGLFSIQPVKILSVKKNRCCSDTYCVKDSHCCEGHVCQQNKCLKKSDAELVIIMAIALIVLAIAIPILCIAGCVIYFVLRAKKKKRAMEEAEKEDDAPDDSAEYIDELPDLKANTPAPKDDSPPPAASPSAFKVSKVSKRATPQPDRGSATPRMMNESDIELTRLDA